MRVLVFCPTHRGPEPETVEAILRLRWGDGFDVMFSFDNPVSTESETDADRFGSAGRANILYNYRKARKATLDGGYGALLTIEQDIIPPSDTIARLILADADIAYGLYAFRTSRPVLNAYRYVVNDGWPDESLSLHPEELRRSWGRVVRVTGLGLGCTLIRRHVLERIDFEQMDSAHCDWALARDALRHGYMLKCDMNVACGHKRPDGVILWPDPASPDGVRCEKAARYEVGAVRQTETAMLARPRARLPAVEMR